MPALPADSTPRLNVDYTVNGRPHTVMVRVASEADVATAMEELDDIWTALGGSNCALSITGARFTPGGSNVSIPVSWTGATGYGSGTANDRFAASYQSFVGRDIEGHRTRLTFYGWAAAGTDDNFRAPEEETGRVHDVLGILDLAEGTFITVNSQQPVWNRYVNTGENAHFRNKFR